MSLSLKSCEHVIYGELMDYIKISHFFYICIVDYEQDKCLSNVKHMLKNLLISMHFFWLFMLFS
jgi:hypothetical protein